MSSKVSSNQDLQFLQKSQVMDLRNLVLRVFLGRLPRAAFKLGQPDPVQPSRPVMLARLGLPTSVRLPAQPGCGASKPSLQNQERWERENWTEGRVEPDWRRSASKWLRARRGNRWLGAGRGAGIVRERQVEDAGRRQLVGARQRVGRRPVARTEGLEEHGLERRGGCEN